MNRTQAQAIVRETFTAAFDRARFLQLTRELLNRLDESKAFAHNSQYVKDAFKEHVARFERLGTYTSPEQETLDVLIVHLTRDSKLERARTAIRNFVADHLKERDDKDAALVAFVSPSETQWRFSYVKMEYAMTATAAGKIGVETRLTPARRFSYIVGAGEACHTAQMRFLDLLQDTANDPTLAQIEDAFSVEAVTKEFFARYVELFDAISKYLAKLVNQDKRVRDEFTAKNISPVDFAKKLLGQIVFLYFVQKKGWLGVQRGQNWGAGPRDFMRRLARGEFGAHANFFNDVLEPLFYESLAVKRDADDWCQRFNCRIPFLNGGLFEPIGDYDWRATEIVIPNDLFFNTKRVDEMISGTGILDVFDRYNFTVNEAEPLEKEVAIDPEMLGKVFENLIEDNRRKGLGAFYTPREIVAYMCQESLINYLATVIASEAKQSPTSDAEIASQKPLAMTVSRADLETFVHLGEQISHYESVPAEYKIKMPKSIEPNAQAIDEALANIAVCDPAVGSGAFPVGMMTEIVRARNALTPYLQDQTLKVSETFRVSYHFKRHAIQNCLYGVDIDAGAVEIAKLRLWLSLVVDEEDVREIKPLPNLDYKIVAGNSLLGVEKNLFNHRLFKRLEELKPLFFDATDKSKKDAYKREIEELIDDLTNGKHLFDFEILFSEVFHRKQGFDVVIGNPPYGFRNVLTPEEKKYFRKERGIEFPSGDVAEVFIVVSFGKLVHSQGALTFIIPKKSLYGESWTNVRKLWLQNALAFLMDASQAFEKVLLEQVAFSVVKSKTTPEREIAIGCLDNRGNSIRVFGKFALPSIFTEDLRNAQIYKGLYSQPLIEKIKRRSVENTSAFIRAEIGISNITSHLTFESEGNHPCVKGVDIVRYALKPNLRYLKRSVARKFIDDYGHEKLIAQEIIAHVQNPQPHIIIAMFLDEQGRLFNDTCVEIKINDKRLTPKFVMAYFHSVFTNWYAYNFVYNRAIRTMHFIDYYVTQIPIPKSVIEYPDQQAPIIARVDRILSAKKRNPEADTSAMEREIDELVYRLYGLTEEEIKILDHETHEKTR
ncbi:MAG: class I SAM-dependent DNA methyltransferase [Chloroflexi bacterium]|nr:class I SAM-dependent DNA methyltransferase [Chloroflexota bacterium]